MPAHRRRVHYFGAGRVRQRLYGTCPATKRTIEESDAAPAWRVYECWVNQGRGRRKGKGKFQPPDSYLSTWGTCGP